MSRSSIKFTINEPVYVGHLPPFYSYCTYKESFSFSLVSDFFASDLLARARLRARAFILRWKWNEDFCVGFSEYAIKFILCGLWPLFSSRWISERNEYANFMIIRCYLRVKSDEKTSLNSRVFNIMILLYLSPFYFQISY